VRLDLRVVDCVARAFWRRFDQWGCPYWVVDILNDTPVEHCELGIPPVPFFFSGRILDKTIRHVRFVEYGLLRSSFWDFSIFDLIAAQ
jgi:hypothetical protein